MHKVWLFSFLFLVLFLPTQLGRHFWPDFSIVSGIRVDYLSPTIYLTDILLVLTLATWGWTKLRKISNFKFQISNFKWNWVLVFIGSILWGIYFSKSPMVGIYGMAKLLEYFLFGFFVANAVDLKENWRSVATFFAIGVLFESLLAIVQFSQQASVGGVFWFFGERAFTGQTPGIANAVLDGQLVLRPYATFSHPNVLAAYLTIAMVVISSEFGVRSSEFGKLLFGAGLLLGTIALFLTMSRVAIALWFFLILFWFWKNFMQQKVFLLVVLACIGSIFFLTPLGNRFARLNLFDESIVRREELTDAAFAIIRDYPVVGVGLNNFIVNLPFYQKTESTVLHLQPVHNIYLLVLAETGILGLAFFLWFIIKTLQKLRTKIFIIYPLSLILILGLFDHYFLTLQQGQLLFSLILGLCWNKSFPLHTMKSRQK